MDQASQADVGDPRSWTLDQVVYHLCHDPNPPWSSKVPAAQFPDAQILEPILRHNHIDGDTLLEIDQEILKNELGVSSFGQRRAIHNAIKFLQGLSPPHHEPVPGGASGAHIQGFTPTHPAVLTSNFSPMHFASPQITRSSNATHVHGSDTTMRPTEPTPNPSTAVIKQPARDCPSDILPAPLAQSSASYNQPEDQASSLLQNMPDVGSRASTTPLGLLDTLEELIDSQSMSKNSDHTTAQISAPNASSRVHHSSETLPLSSTRDARRKRIAPIPVMPDETAALLEKRDTTVESSSETYLSTSAIPIQSIFYNRIVTDFSDTYRLPADDTKQLQSTGHHYPNGQRQVVARLMKGFLYKRNHYHLERPRSVAVVPYRLTDLGKKFSEQLFTIFPSAPNLPRVCNVADYPALGQALVEERESGGGQMYTYPRESSQEDVESLPDDLAYLVAKYGGQSPDRDEVLPLFGDSGDEGELDDKTWQEYQEEQREKLTNPSAMTLLEVDATIDNAIEDIKNDWRRKKLPMAQAKGYRLWMAAAKLRSNREALNAANREKTRCLNYIHRMKEAIRRDVWQTPSELKKQCESMEVSVFSLQESNYLIDILERETAPIRPSREQLRARGPRREVLVEDGEEIIDSEPEEELANLMDDFLECDSDDSGSIHHDTEMALDDWNPAIPNMQPLARDPAESLDALHPQLTSQVLPDAPHTPGDDADIDSEEDEIITPRRRKPMTPRKAANLNQIQKASPLHPDMGSDMSDLDQAVRASKNKPQNPGASKSQAIDLTVSSPASGIPSDFEVRTPKLNPQPDGTPQSREIKKERHVSDMDSPLPKYSDVEGILRISWPTLQDTHDQHRALAKSVYLLKVPLAKGIRDFVMTLGTEDARKDTFTHLLIQARDGGEAVAKFAARWRKFIPFLLPLYMSFIFSRHQVDCALSEDYINTAYEDLDETLSPFLDLLCELVEILLNHGEVQNPNKEDKENKKRKFLEVADESTDVDSLADDSDLHMQTASEGIDKPPSSAKKRKRKVIQSQAAIAQQQSDQARIREDAQRKAIMERRLKSYATTGDMICPINFDEDATVFLDQHISTRVKPHQLKGIQFMWREIIEDPKHQGCILAHTMGLGKTMQVISLLVTIANCNRSSNPKIRALIPTHLRQSKTLILCPPSLLDNWHDELLMWSPQKDCLGPLYKYSSPKEAGYPIEWARTGGVLLIGYEKFQRLVMGKSKTGEPIEAIASESEDIDGVREILMGFPNLVIADEAHRLKNRTSKTALAAKQLKTLSRIALTGSPLSNNLEEYFSLVDWIAPAYLGTIIMFKAKYSEPIKQGLYATSTEAERRKCLRKLHVLKKDLAPKVNRADISAIEEDLPPKTEYFLTVPLTELQKEAYNTYVGYLLDDAASSDVNTNAKLWDWLSILSLLCNHPSSFVDKLRTRSESDKIATSKYAKATVPNDSDDAPSPDETASPDDVSLNDESSPLVVAMHKAMEVFKGLSQKALRDPALSNRTMLVQQIVKEAITANDKTLIFSQSIPSLNYLESMFKDMNCQYCRIDGGTTTTKRQEMTKKFNVKGGYQVFLISTKAGGLGLNLQGANRVIIYDFSWNPTWEEQAVGRAYRLGQQRPVFVYRFRTGGTFEKAVHDQAVFKTQLFKRVVDQRQPERYAAAKISDYIFPVKDVEQSEFNEVLGKDPRVLDAILSRVDCVRNIELTETFLKEDGEELSKEELEEAEKEFAQEKLQRDNPHAYQAKLLAQEMASASRRATGQSTPSHPTFGNGSLQRFSHTVHGHGPATTSYGSPGTIPKRNLPFSLPPPFHRSSFRATNVVASPRARQTAVTGDAIPRQRMSYDDTYQDLALRSDPRRNRSQSPAALRERERQPY